MDRVSVRTEIDGLRQEVAEGRKARDVAVDVRNWESLVGMDCVERYVSKMSSSNQESFRSVQEAVFRSGVD